MNNPQSAFAALKKQEPEDLVLRLTAVPRPMSSVFDVQYRKANFGKAVLWVLTAGELSRARWQAEKECKIALGEDAKVGSLAYEEQYEQEKAYQLVALALRSPEPPHFPIFPTAALVRDHLTDDEISVICRAYGMHRVQSGPIISEMTPEEMEALIEILRKGFDRLPLSRFSGELQTDLILYLVSKLPTSPTGTSSAGSPPDAPSTTTSDPAAEPPSAPAAEAP